MKFVKVGFFSNGCHSLRKIDVVIPTLPKDFDVLSLTIESLHFIEHQINKIYIVAPESYEVRQFCLRNKLIFIDELSVLGFGKGYINYQVNGFDHSGWIFQQLLKLSGENFTEMDDYVVVDSDTVFVNKICFFKDGKYIFFANEEWHKPYFNSFRNFFGYEAPTKWSLTSHMMIFNKYLLREMKCELERRFSSNWHDVYISSKNSLEQSCVSDYETYGNWVLYNHSKIVKIKPLLNKNASRKMISNLASLCISHKFYHSVSFHSYLSNK